MFSDKQRIDGKSTVSFFVNNLEPDDSVTRTFESEDETVNWLMDNDDFPRMLFENLFHTSNSVIFHCGVKEPITNSYSNAVKIILTFFFHNNHTLSNKLHPQRGR